MGVERIPTYKCKITSNDGYVLVSGPKESMPEFLAFVIKDYNDDSIVVYDKTRNVFYTDVMYCTIDYTKTKNKNYKQYDKKLWEWNGWNVLVDSSCTVRIDEFITDIYECMEILEAEMLLL